MRVPEYDFEIEQTTVYKGTVSFIADSEEEAQTMCEKLLKDLNSDSENVMVPNAELDSEIWEML